MAKQVDAEEAKLNLYRKAKRHYGLKEDQVKLHKEEGDTCRIVTVDEQALLYHGEE